MPSRSHRLGPSLLSKQPRGKVGTGLTNRWLSPLAIGECSEQHCEVAEAARQGKLVTHQLDRIFVEAYW